MFAEICGILAALCQVYGYWQYIRIVDKGDINPNGTSWGLWGIGSFIGFILTKNLTHDWTKELLPLLCSLSAFFVFVRFFVRRKMEMPDKFELKILVLDALIVAYWITGGDTRAAMAAFVLDIIISFLPIYREVWNKPSIERAEPWRTWTAAYTLLFITVVLNWVSWWELVYPAVCLVLHGFMWWMIRCRTTAAVANI